MARSGMPSPLKSALTEAMGAVPAVVAAPLQVRLLVGEVTVNRTGFEMPPPGAGLLTVTTAVAAEAMLFVGTAAVSWLPLTKVVERAEPLQFTVAPETNPVPWTVRVNPALPGVMLAGIKG